MKTHYKEINQTEHSLMLWVDAYRVFTRARSKYLLYGAHLITYTQVYFYCLTVGPHPVGMVLVWIRGRPKISLVGLQSLFRVVSRTSNPTVKRHLHASRKTFSY